MSSERRRPRECPCCRQFEPADSFYEVAAITREGFDVAEEEICEKCYLADCNPFTGDCRREEEGEG